MTEKRSIVFTDGAAKGNPGPGGWGAIVVTPDGRVRELGAGSGHTTNNRMEMAAVIGALRALENTPGPVDVYADSTYVIRGITEWIHGWRRRGWKTAEGSDVLNRDLWESLSRLVMARGARGIRWHYVRGHSDIPGNERCDEIAVTFAAGEHPGFYDGPLAEYPVDLRAIPDDTSVPVRKDGAGGRKKSAPAFSYLSIVGGQPMRHTTWADCERRVKGVSGAKFKKSSSAEDEAAILRAWGRSPADLKS